MRRVSVGIDGYNLAMPNGTGIATYGFVLAETLSAAGHRVEGVFGVDAGNDAALRDVLFFDRIGQPPRDIRSKWQRRVRGLRHRIEAVTPSPRRAVEVPLTDRVEKRAFATRLPSFARLTTSADLFEAAHRRFARSGRFTNLIVPEPPEIMHWTYPVPVRLVGARNIYTLHDLVPLRLPYTTLDHKAQYAALVRGCADRGDHLCTVSEASAADIRAFAGLPADRVTNTYQSSALVSGGGAEETARAAAAVEGLFGLLADRYFLFFGALEPKKNVGRLLQAYLGLSLETPLVIVGARAWKAEGELALLQTHDAAAERADRSRIIRLDYLSRDVLVQLVRGARAVLFTSLFEGFGLPALEALQLGTPLLTSDTSSLPEVVGDAALRIDPYDVGSIAAGIKALDDDADLRARLRAAGPIQAEAFSRQRYLARLEAMYSRVLGES